eukprot:6949361-Pyramimonas_sp.AAC.1
MKSPERINRQGLWVECDSVKGASDKGFRRELEQRDQRWLHLRRSASCAGCKGRENELHCKEYAAIDNEAIVDLGDYSKFTPCRIFVWLWRWLGLTYKLL